MLVKTVEISELPNKNEHECSAWCKDDGYYAETHTVQCVTPAFYQTTYKHWGINGRIMKKTRRFWCANCLPGKFRPYMRTMG